MQLAQERTDHVFKYIVGNKFSQLKCISGGNVITTRDMEERIEKENFNWNEIYVYGQGVEHGKIEVLNKEIEKHGSYVLNGFKHTSKQEHTHKINPWNTMIADPIVVTKNSLFKSELFLDDNCAELSDHTTGVHIQGMILIEAARQTMLSVAEKFILPPEMKGNSYCILNNISSDFKQFAFPIETKILHEVKEITGKNYSYISTSKFLQNNIICCEVKIEHKFFDKEFLLKKEQLLAKKSIENYIETIPFSNMDF